MSSQVLGVSQLPFINKQSFSCPDKLCSVTSVNSNGTKFLHFPYPWIPDSDFVRPSSGYQISGTPGGNYASALAQFCNIDWRSTGTNDGRPDVRRIRSSGVGGTDPVQSSIYNMAVCTGYPSQSSYRFLNMRPVSANSAYSTTHQKSSLITDVSVTGGTKSYAEQWNNSPGNGTCIAFTTDGSLTKVHATFFYGVTFTTNSSEYFSYSIASGMRGICRYKPINSSFSDVSCTTSIAYSTEFTNTANNVKYTYILFRINWNARQSFGQGTGSKSVGIELPSVYLNIDSLTGTNNAIVIGDIHGVFVFSKV